jgi:hypothetical protein
MHFECLHLYISYFTSFSTRIPQINFSSVLCRKLSTIEESSVNRLNLVFLEASSEIEIAPFKSSIRLRLPRRCEFETPKAVRSTINSPAITKTNQCAASNQEVDMFY